jgi:iron complex transport system ATP-binding protein
MIELRDFHFAIEGKPILKDVSLTIASGEFAMLLGPNGAGKSTLLKCLMRIYRGGTGEITLDDRPLESYTQRDLARQLSYVPQATGRQCHFTVYDFVAMGRYPHLSTLFTLGSHDQQIIDDALDRTDTGRFADRDVDTLSGGEQQKVFVAAALAQEPRLMLLDEPTAFLDPKHQDEVLELLTRLNEQGITILSVSHDINMAATHGTHVIAIREGRVAFDGAPSDVMNNDVLEGIYDKRFDFVEDSTSQRKFVVPGKESFRNS